MSAQVRTYPALEVFWPEPARGSAEFEDRLASALDDIGAVAAQQLTSSWRVFFATPAARDRAAGVLESGFRPHGVTVATLDVADDDWARRSQADQRAVVAGRFVVAPPWHVPAPIDRGDAILILIEPSMGFGTGHHATTRLCLRAMSALDLADRSFLDVGTGSGVLAIAACLLGARPVTAIDTDPDAIDSARRNLQMNAVTERVRLVTGDFRDMHALSAATIAANLTGAALIKDCRGLTRLVEGGGMLVVSGFLREEAADVHAALARHGRIVSGDEEDGWSAASVQVHLEATVSHDRHRQPLD